MADLNDFKNKDTKFTGTTGQRISIGATGTRVNETGRLRFNTSTNLLEYYTGTLWKSIDAPPTIVSFGVDGVTPSTSQFVDRTLSGNATIVITGSLFSSGATVDFLGSASANISATSVTVDNASQITALIPHSSFLAAQEPYDIKVTNPSGLSAQLDNCLSVDAKPVFATASGSLGSIRGGDVIPTGGTLLSAAATDPDGDTITYSVSSGSLPPGLSLNTSTGAISGTPTTPGSDTTSTFTVTAATTSQSQSRQFSITVRVPVITSFTSTGSFNYSVPSGITSVQVLVLAGGGAGNNIGGGGGGGGVVIHNSFPVTPGGTVPGSVGAGAPQPGSGNHGTPTQGNRGSDSTFGTLTAKGGGGTRSWSAQAGPASPEGPGGSGGGGCGQDQGGLGIQPSTPNPGATNYGFPGAAGGNYPPGGNNGTTGAGTHSGGGGGGAGAAGGHPSQSGPGNTSTNQQAGRKGGDGVLSTISGSSVYYGGGGAGSSHAGGYNIGNVPGGAGNEPAGTVGQGGGAGVTNRGGGGGGGHYPEHNGAAGGPGIVIVKA